MNALRETIRQCKQRYSALNVDTHRSPAKRKTNHSRSISARLCGITLQTMVDLPFCRNWIAPVRISWIVYGHSCAFSETLNDPRKLKRFTAFPSRSVIETLGRGKERNKRDVTDRREPRNVRNDCKRWNTMSLSGAPCALCRYHAVTPYV